jgi:DNA-directed RNA polymerase alpha subunit
MLWKGFQRPKRLEVDRESLTSTYGRFIAQPFERGFATTIGNALRRCLLSSIEGAAITAIHIEGVLHEFSSVSGVQEDVTDIILNLKQVPIRLHTDEPKVLSIDVEGSGKVTAGQMSEDAQVEIVDPSIHIATPNEGGRLKLQAQVKRGRGYVSADRNFDESMGIGWIPVDSAHSPVRRVNYRVEAARLGQTTDYERLILEVWTNGTVSPEEAVSLAAMLLKDHLGIFIQSEESRDARSSPAWTRCWPRTSTSSISRCARPTRSRMPTSTRCAISCAGPRRTCWRPRTSARSPSRRCRRSWRSWVFPSAWKCPSGPVSGLRPKERTSCVMPSEGESWAGPPPIAKPCFAISSSRS